MKFKQVPPAFALAVAVGAMAWGCTQDNAPAPADVTAAPVERPDIDAHAARRVVDHAPASSDALGVDFPLPADHVPWEPDVPLIEGMARVRTAVGGLVPDHPADAASVATRVDEIDAAVDYMFANCSLDTAPDIALHAVLARLKAGTHALQGNPADTSAMADLHAAVENYEQLFDDPNTGARIR